MIADVEKYSRRSSDLQREAQADFVGALDASAREAGLRRDSWHRQASGDGELAIFPPEIREAAVLSAFLRALDRHLRRLNTKLQPQAKVRVRLAVHQGPIYLDAANGYAGTAVNDTARLADAPVLKAALRAFPGAAVACIVSRGVYEDVVAEGYDGIRADRFRRVRVRLPDKEFDADAWITVVDEDVHGMPDPGADGAERLPEPEPEPGPEPGPARAASGDAAVRVGSVSADGSQVAIGTNPVAIGQAGNDWTFR
jgi:class 3 adenylate cyclase